VAFALYTTKAANKASLTEPNIANTINESVTTPAEQLSQAYAAVVAQVKPAVVSVYSEKMVNMQAFPFPFEDPLFEEFFANPPARQPRRYSVPQHGMGSGMILDHQGHRQTNYHVVADVDQIKVQLSDKRRFNAKVIGSDAKTDVAVIKIVGDIPRHLPIVRLGQPSVQSLAFCGSMQCVKIVTKKVQ
jgi:serine protease Do